MFIVLRKNMLNELIVYFIIFLLIHTIDKFVKRNLHKVQDSSLTQDVSSYCPLKNRRKYTFSFYILTFFHFGPYILILPLLVPKPINT